MDEVLNYIDYLKSKIEKEPQCFLFALLLKVKFDNAILYYDNNHIITKIHDKYYDWNGVIEKGRHIPFEDYGDNWIVIHYQAIQNYFKNENI